jgi:hypothetical protein
VKYGENGYTAPLANIDDTVRPQDLDVEQVDLLIGDRERKAIACCAIEDE